ncbi:hypothetical protein [Bradyrhizobium sp. SHOUNA76]|uniref:hypothetical protein n=1 Tax=Bradyrhizobium sp. SHOUNA76 TaxID=2908927 RepID=UPI001FF6835E|nr:hypothetical protein [Bradyrhizobium sp. SHOUNA76]MCJ9701729.1 hypothetical protein [Bradyrhizobium sp. SHOUNA76]
MTAATEIYYNGRTHAEHCAWLDGLTGDEYRIVHMPVGHLFSLAVVSVIKQRLLTVEMTAGHRMKLLDGIATVIDGPVTAEAVAAIEAADPVGLKMMHEIMRLPIERQIHAFRDADVFRLMAQLNPSLLAALKRCRWGAFDRSRMGDM